MHPQDVIQKVTRNGLHEDDVFIKVLFGALTKALPTPVYRRLYAMISRNDEVVVKYIEYTSVSPPLEGDEGISWHELKSFEDYTVPIRDMAVTQHESGDAFLYGIPSNMSTPAIFLMNDDGGVYYRDLDYYAGVDFPTEHAFETIAVPPLIAQQLGSAAGRQHCLLDTEGISSSLPQRQRVPGRRSRLRGRPRREGHRADSPRSPSTSRPPASANRGTSTRYLVGITVPKARTRSATWS